MSCWNIAPFTFSHATETGLPKTRVFNRIEFFAVWSKYARHSAGVVVYDERSAMRDRFHWARLLAFVTGLVNQELLLRNEYLVAENRILRAHLPARLRLSDAERSTLAEIAKRLGRKALQEIARVAKLDTLLAWYRRLVAQKFDGARYRAYPGRPRISPEVEELVVRFARENRSWGYDRIVGA